MKYSRKSISKAGQIIISSNDWDEVADAIKVVNDWRELHLPVIKLLMEELKSFFHKNACPIVFSSYRLKRMSSIQYKLDLNPQMGLGGMQDIAGGRFVFQDISILNNAKNFLLSYIIPHFELVKTNDYISEPKDSGYRSIHLVYQYHSPTNEEWDQMKVEIQLRTRLQHSWAMAVETAGLVTNTAMKSGQGSDDWQYFFHLVSCLFSKKERTPVMQKYHSETSKYLIDKLQKIDRKNKYSDQLQALKQSLRIVENKSFSDEIYLLYIDFSSKSLRIQSFDKESTNRANEQYNRIEEQIIDGHNAAVLVSVSDFKELKEAYPSYFLDMEDFNHILKKYLSVGKNSNLRKRS